MLRASPEQALLRDPERFRRQKRTDHLTQFTENWIAAAARGVARVVSRGDGEIDIAYLKCLNEIALTGRPVRISTDACATGALPTDCFQSVGLMLLGIPELTFKQNNTQTKEFYKSFLELALSAPHIARARLFDGNACGSADGRFTCALERVWPLPPFLEGLRHTMGASFELLKVCRYKHSHSPNPGRAVCGCATVQITGSTVRRREPRTDLGAR